MATRRVTIDEPATVREVNALVADVAELRTQVIALLAKIDADSGDTGGDSDYESTLTPAAQTSVGLTTEQVAPPDQTGTVPTGRNDFSGDAPGGSL